MSFEACRFKACIILKNNPDAGGKKSSLDLTDLSVTSVQPKNTLFTTICVI